MKKPPLLLALTALLCAAGAWFAFCHDGDPDLAPPAAQPGASAPVVDPGIGGSSGGPSATDATAPAPGPTARDAVLTHEALVALPEDAKWAEVRIVDKETHEPVPGAEVSWYDETVSKELQKRPELVVDRIGMWRDTEAVATRFGWHTQSDQNGIARFHQTADTKVCARLGNRFGKAELGANLVPPRGGFEIAIEFDFAVLVQVIDADGSPADEIPVAIGRHDAQGKFLGFRNWGPEALTCAPDGIAVLPHAQEWTRGNSETKQWRVHTNLPGIGDDRGVPVVLEPPPTEPIVLRLPDCGGVRARIAMRADGTTGQRFLQLRENAHNEGRMWMRTLQAPIADDGWAHFRHVPLGLQLNVSGGANGGWLGENFAGPVAAGAIVDVTLAPKADTVLFTGRLLDENRQPLPRQKFLLRTTGRNGNATEATTDDAGAFLVLIASVRAERPERNQVDAITASAKPADGHMRTARLPGRELRAGTENLGDIVLGFDPIVVAGHYVVDGKPQKAEAGGRIEQLLPPSENSREERWERVDDLPDPDQQEDGSFEVRGVVPPGRYRLRVWPNRAAPIEPIEFRLGATDVTVTLRTVGGLAATMLLPTGASSNVQGRLVPVDAPEAVALPENQRRRLASESWARPDGRQQIDWQPLPEGIYRLELTLPGFPDDVIATVDGVQLPPSKERDPRLVDIDLCPSVRLQEIRVTDDVGKAVQPWDGGMFPMPQNGKMLEGLSPQNRDGKHLMPLRAVDVFVAYPGFRPRTAACSGQPVEIRLDRWPTVTLTFPQLPALPEGCELQASLAPPDDLDQRQFRSAWNSGSLGRLISPPRNRMKVENGKVELPVGDAPQRVELTVRKQRSSTAVVLEPQTVSLATQTFAVQVTAEAVQKAGAEAAAKKQ